MKILMILAIVAIFAGVSTLHYVTEDTRLAHVVGGNYQGLLGPGWVFLVPGTSLVQPLTIGDAGVVVAEGRVDFAGQVMPVRGDSGPAGMAVQIESFRDQGIWVRGGGVSPAQIPSYPSGNR